MALRTQVQTPQPHDVVVSDIYASRFFYFGKDDKRTRGVGNYVAVRFTGYGEDSDFDQWHQYTNGEVKSIAPATRPEESSAIILPDNDPFVLNPANDAELRGDYLWSFLNAPWEKGHITEGSNFSLLWTSFAESGYCDLPGGDRSAYLEIPGTRHIALKEMFLGLQCHIVSVPKPEITSTDKRYQRKNPNATHYLVDKCYGFADDVASLANAAMYGKFKPFAEALIASGKPIPAAYDKLREMIILQGSALFTDKTPQDALSVFPEQGPAYETWLSEHVTVVDGNIVGLK